mmetsp:Transcript_22802/g.63618  ORF Transcript_22802/g.63618 Transcript_22802/m.63618 type:complete len:220 (+) Transcript_22802:325-984(+)
MPLVPRDLLQRPSRRMRPPRTRTPFTLDRWITPPLRKSCCRTLRPAELWSASRSCATSTRDVRRVSHTSNLGPKHPLKMPSSSTVPTSRGVSSRSHTSASTSPHSSAAGVKADVEGAVVEAVATVADAAVTEEATAEDVVATSPTIIIEHISSPCHDRDQQFQVLPSSKVCAGTSIQIRVHGQAGECAVSCHIVSCYSMLLGWAAGRRGQGWQPFMLQA